VKAPLLIFLLTALSMIILGLVRRRHFFSGLMAGFFSVMIAIFALYIPLDEALSVFGVSIRFDGRWQILGRSLILNANNRAAVGFIFIAGGFILAGAWIARPVRLYYSLTIGILGVIAASLMIDPFLFAAIFIELAAIGSTLVLSSRRPGGSRGGLRLLSFYTLAMLAILLVGWSLEINETGIDLEGMDLALQMMLGFGFAILISIPPFHAWLPIAAEENHPFTWNVIATVLHGAALFFIVRYISTFYLPYENEMLFPIIRSIGATMALLCAIWSAVQKDLQKMASYALISDLGVMLVAIGLGSNEGFQLALGLTGARVIGVACLSMGLMHVWKILHNSNLDRQSKEFLPSMLATSAIIVGFLSLAGFPLTAGFPGRWSLLTIIAPLDTYAWIGVVGSMGILCVGAIRSARTLLYQSHAIYVEIVDWREKIFLGGGLFLTLSLGIFPQLLFPWIVKALEGFTLPV
jgi:formate hydrogenlyase subunit 3/multisubunit Na+/H+ antiporter MnhD subunit